MGSRPRPVGSLVALGVLGCAVSRISVAVPVATGANSRRWLRAGGRACCPRRAEAVRPEATVCPHCPSELMQTPAAR
jgi:hypothetical protein